MEDDDDFKPIHFKKPAKKSDKKPVKALETKKAAKIRHPTIH